jgi:hypothetical protein
LNGGGDFVPRRSRGAAGVDGVFGRFGSSSTARFYRGKSAGHRSEGAHEGEEEIETRRVTRGLRDALEFDLGALQHGKVWRSIATVW